MRAIEFYKVYISSWNEVVNVVVVASDIDLTLKENQQGWFLTNYAGIVLNEDYEEHVSKIEKCDIYVCADNPESDERITEVINFVKQIRF